MVPVMLVSVFSQEVRAFLHLLLIRAASVLSWVLLEQKDMRLCQPQLPATAWASLALIPAVLSHRELREDHAPSLPHQSAPALPKRPWFQEEL